MDCHTCQNKHLDYGFFCVDCDPWDPKLTNYEDMHESEEDEWINPNVSHV